MNPIALISIFAVITSAVIIKFASPQQLISKFTSAPSPSPSQSPAASPIVMPSPKASAVSAAPVNNTPPRSGFSYQRVSADGQTYNVSIIAADLNSTKVIVDTASESDCGSDCPVLSLGEYVGRNGARAVE